jgi:carbohydrate kinase (thermoresistant glucokinase family)
MYRLVIMGVSGSGKSTVARALADRQGVGMIDGDELHLPASIAKMKAGIPLQDDDRWPWLDRVGAELANAPAGLIVACSALRKSYRDRIRVRAGRLRFIFLEGGFDLIHQRMSHRADHFMKPDLLHSQFATLERPGPDELDIIALDIDRPIDVIVEEIIEALPWPGQDDSIRATGEAPPAAGILQP